jgi:hypothetical protein
MSDSFQLSDRIEINLDAVITSNGSMLSAWASGEIVAMTDKAVKLQAITESGKEITCWFPKKALQVFSGNRTNPFDNETAHYVTLARWFRLNDWTLRFLNLTRESHTLRG